ncbi:MULTISPECIES: hypothetical protein [unclassified Clostridium]|uniref:hypothetical protein n=1 Tax=unclassified Clostridium TaxID=2614128 RepID=UPI0025BCBBC6|nr:MULTISPECIES: hypothetical protein [unclassified Clostridium]
MDYIQKVETEYLKLSDNQYSVPIPLGDFKFNKWEEFINCDIRFKVEFLTLPSWSGNFKYLKLNEEFYSHIKIKSKLDIEK